MENAVEKFLFSQMVCVENRDGFRNIKCVLRAYVNLLTNFYILSHWNNNYLIMEINLVDLCGLRRQPCILLLQLR